MQTPILTYHSIGERVPPHFRPWVVHPRRFRDHLRSLAEVGLQTLTVSDLVRRRVAGLNTDRAVVLTFDDGFADFLRNAMPIMQEFGMTGTLYVITGMLGGAFRSLPVLDWRDLADIRDSGIEIGAHTVSHPALDRLAPAQARDEVSGCKKQLEDRLGVAVGSFAYPFGFYTRETRKAVIDAGYTSACAVGYRFSPADDDPFALRRVIVGERYRQLDRLPPVAAYCRLRSSGFALLRRTLTRWVGYAE
jgi:peptidoglycan/xylan/chitin deacetylase (PgdA/CDA1 family)